MRWIASGVWKQQMESIREGRIRRVLSRRWRSPPPMCLITRYWSPCSVVKKPCCWRTGAMTTQECTSYWNGEGFRMPSHGDAIPDTGTETLQPQCGAPPCAWGTCLSGTQVPVWLSQDSLSWIENRGGFLRRHQDAHPWRCCAFSLSLCRFPRCQRPQRWSR